MESKESMASFFERLVNQPIKFSRKRKATAICPRSSEQETRECSRTERSSASKSARSRSERVGGDAVSMAQMACTSDVPPPNALPEGQVPRNEHWEVAKMSIKHAFANALNQPVKFSRERKATAIHPRSSEQETLECSCTERSSASKSARARSERVGGDAVSTARMACTSDVPPPNALPEGQVPRNEHWEVTKMAMKHALANALSETPSTALRDVMYDLKGSLVKTCAASARLIAELACMEHISPEELEDILNRGARIEDGPSEDPKQLKEMIAHLQDENSSSLSVIETQLSDLKRYELTVATLKTEIDDMEKASSEQEQKLQKQIADLGHKLQIQIAGRSQDAVRSAELLAASRQSEEEARRELEALKKDFNLMKSFLEDHVPKLKTETFKDCMEIYLKKILKKFPDADIDYFTDVGDVPSDVDLQPEWLEFGAGASNAMGTKTDADCGARPEQVVGAHSGRVEGGAENKVDVDDAEDDAV